MPYRIIITIGKHVIAQEALAGGGEGIGVEEAAQRGVVIAALEVIKFALGDVNIAVVYLSS